MFDFLGHGSYLAIVVTLILTGCGLPIPEEVPIVAAGVLSSPEVGQLNPWLALASCIVGVLIGDMVIYWVGYHFGRGVVRNHRWWSHLVTPEREMKMEEMIRRHGMKVFFVARFMVGLRAPIYMTAGILRLPFLRYLFIDVVCATIVVGLFFSLSYFFGPRVGKWIHETGILLTIVVVLLAVLAGAYLWRRHRQSGREEEKVGASD
ncbi:MAG: DedA family protein [Planctomycetes bacterium]|nr:DedA family protein [Planctomycetota bacterium]